MDRALPRGTWIDSPEDPRVAAYRDLRRDDPARSRVTTGTTVIVEGHLALSRALAGPLELTSVLVTPGRASSLPDLLDALPGSVELFVAERPVLAALTGFDVHRGVLACAERPEPTTPSQLLGGSRRVLALEGLTDLENVGASFRVAAALGLDAVLVDHRCADPLRRRCVRVSLGWSTVVPHARTDRGEGLVGTLAGAGLRTVALTPRGGSVPVDEAASQGLLDEPFALLVGAEGPGLEEDTIRAADHRVRIPMANGVDSLNAATSLAVVASFAAAGRGWT